MKNMPSKHKAKGPHTKPKKQKKGGMSGPSLLSVVTGIRINKCGIPEVNGLFQWSDEFEMYTSIPESKNPSFEIEHFDLINLGKKGGGSHHGSSKKKRKGELEWIGGLVDSYNCKAECSSDSCSDLMRPRILRSGFWLLSMKKKSDTTDDTSSMKKQSIVSEQLYACNCPFSEQIPTSNWFFLDDPKLNSFARSSDSSSSSTDGDSSLNPRRPPQLSRADEATTVFAPESDIMNHDQKSSKRRKLSQQSGSEMFRGGYVSLKSDLPSEAVRSKRKRMGEVSKVKGVLPFVQAARETGSLVVISGGQTGVDQAGLDAAHSRAISVSGWMPKGFETENGVIDRDRYSTMLETHSDDCSVRTEKNVLDADATLIVSFGRRLEGGSKWTQQCVAKYEREFMSVVLKKEVRVRGSELSQLWVTDDKGKTDDHCEDGTGDRSGVDAKSEADKDEDVPMTKSTPHSSSEDECSDQESNHEDTLQEFVDGRVLRVAEWIRARNIRVLNVAGPRESESPGIYERSLEFLSAVFKHFEGGSIPERSLFDQ